MAERFQERGVALLVVLTSIALVTAVVADFQYSSRVDYQLAVNAKDELQAEYNALSALRMRALLLRNARKIQTFVQGLSTALGMDASQALPLGQVLEMIPVECGLLSAITKKTNGFASDTEGSDTDFFQGDCMATSTSEHSKISLNMLRNPNNRVAERVTQLLVGVLADKRFERFFEEDDRTGSHADNPAELVGAIIDYVDRDKNEAINNVGDEDRHYAYLKDSYLPKNAPFDSVAELQLVFGIGDELYEILKDRISIYHDGTSIELSTASIEEIFFGLAASLMDGVDVSLFLSQPQVGEFLRTLVELKTLGATGFGILNITTLTTLLQATGLMGLFDAGKIRQNFSDKSTTAWYTIDAVGSVGLATRHIRAVYQAMEGQFYYMRLE